MVCTNTDFCISFTDRACGISVPQRKIEARVQVGGIRTSCFGVMHTAMNNTLARSCFS